MLSYYVKFMSDLNKYSLLVGYFDEATDAFRNA
jgi:hypothetical protein